MKDVLNAHQLAAVKSVDGPLLVLAGAGSGKTRVIIQKIAYLIEACRYKASHVVAVTFTNKAAHEMLLRIRTTLPSEKRRGLWILTFHALGLRIIRSHLKELGFKDGFSIYDTEDSLKLFSTWLMPQKAEEKAYVLSLYGYISRWKNQLLTKEDVLSLTPIDETFEMAQTLYEPYQKALLSFNAVDFDDLMMLPVQLLRENEKARVYWQNKVRYLLVDEYQDSNLAQYELVKLLTGISARFTVVGDDSQSIYAWRGAEPQNLAKLQNDYSALKVIKLEQNYRSSSHILKVANALISHNPQIIEKKLWSTFDDGDLVRILCCKNEQDEAHQVVSDLVAKKLKTGNPWHDFAILYRGNYQARFFETLLREHGIDCQLYGGTSWFSLPEIRAIFSAFRLLCNPNDDASFMRVILSMGRGIGAKTLETLASYAHQRGESLYDCASHLALQTMLQEKPRQLLLSFKEWMEKIKLRLVSEPSGVVLRQLVEESGYEERLCELHESSAKIKRSMENIEELIQWIERVMEKDASLSLGETLNRLTLVEMLDQNSERREDAVQMMTLHASKGLEFPFVYLVGMEESLLPHHQSMSEEGIQEERRLAYVGMTRAKKTLCLSYAQKRKREGEWQSTEESRFLQELPVTSLEWIGRADKICEDKLKERASAHLSFLKEMLASE